MQSIGGCLACDCAQMGIAAGAGAHVSDAIAQSFLMGFATALRIKGTDEPVLLCGEHGHALRGMLERMGVSTKVEPLGAPS